MFGFGIHQMQLTRKFNRETPCMVSNITYVGVFVYIKISIVTYVIYFEKLNI